MTDFYISAIRMDNKGQHIEWVKTHKNIDNKSIIIGVIVFYASNSILNDNLFLLDSFVFHIFFTPKARI